MAKGSGGTRNSAPGRTPNSGEREFEDWIGGRVSDFANTHPEWVDKKAAKNREELEETWKAILDNHDIGMATNIKALEGIIEDGFKAYGEIGVTSSHIVSVLPRESYDRMVKSGMKFKNSYEDMVANAKKKLKDIRDGHEKMLYGRVENEKYGALIDKNLKSLNDSGLGGYGNVVIKFKDSVRGKSTWTMGDSLNYTKSGKQSPMMPSSINKPKIESMGTQGKSGKSRKYPTKGDAHIPMKSLSKKLGVSYVEVQMHGKLTYKDIDYVYISKKDYASIPQKMRSKLKFRLLD